MEVMSTKDLEIKTVVSFIEENYLLKVSGEPVLMDGGVENGVFQIKTQDGDFVAKFFTSDNSVEFVEREVAIYDYLNERGVVAPDVVKTSDGSGVSVLNREGTKYPVVVMKFEELRRSTPSTITDEELARIAKNMGKINKLLQEFPEKEKISKTYVTPKEDWIVNNWQTFLSSKNRGEFTNEEVEKMEGLNKRMVELLGEDVNRDNLTVSVLHGDLGLEHARFLPDGKVYFFDFSDYSAGPVIWELATFIQNLYREGPITLERWQEMQQIVLKAYQEEFPLTQQDLSNLPKVMLRRILLDISYLDNFSAKAGHTVDSKGNRRRYELAEALLQEI